MSVEYHTILVHRDNNLDETAQHHIISQSILTDSVNML